MSVFSAAVIADWKLQYVRDLFLRAIATESYRNADELLKQDIASVCLQLDHTLKKIDSIQDEAIRQRLVSDTPIDYPVLVNQSSIAA